MAHFAKLDENNIVLQVVVVNNSELLVDGVEEEAKGVEFLTNIFNYAHWKQTSFNATFRKNSAGIGYIYDYGRDAFIPPQPFPSWLLNEETCLWEAPIAYPEDGNKYSWDEELKQWKMLDISN
jgi:hypothetical protein